VELLGDHVDVQQGAGRIGVGVTLSVVRAGTLLDVDVVPEELH